MALDLTWRSHDDVPELGAKVIPAISSLLTGALYSKDNVGSLVLATPFAHRWEFFV
jgi:hypothetical protein